MAIRSRPLHRWAAVAAALALGGCGLLSDDQPDVLVVGDSVTQMAGGPIESAVDGADVTIEGHFGFRTDELVEPARRGVEDEPDVAVIVTGYNDLLQDTVETDALADVAEAVAAVDCVIWVLLPEQGSYPQELAERWNERLTDVAEGSPNAHVTTEWRDLVDASPPGTYLLDDDLHPSAEGSQALGDVIDRAIAQSCPLDT